MQYQKQLQLNQIESQSYKCVQQNQGEFFCIEETCNEQNNIICLQKNCQCKKKHFKCKIIQIQNLIDSINSKSKLVQKFKALIQESFDKMIDQISILRDKIIQNVSKVAFFNQNDIQILYLLKSSQNQKLTGSLLNSLYTNVQKQDNSNEVNNEINILIANLFDKVRQELNFFSEKIDSLKSKDDLNNLGKLSIKSINSLILTKNSEVQILQNFIKDQKRIKQLKFLYRASQNAFSTKIFHEKCSNIPNTVVLVRTQFNKIIGGYTPLVWKQGNQQVGDPSGKTFIFSLTNNHKFVLTEYKKAIQYETGWGPKFGIAKCCDLAIAQGQKNSYCFDRLVYKHQKYQKNKQSYELFTGSQNYSFKISQWQVFQVIF